MFSSSSYSSNNSQNILKISCVKSIDDVKWREDYDSFVKRSLAKPEDLFGERLVETSVVLVKFLVNIFQGAVTSLNDTARHEVVDSCILLLEASLRPDGSLAILRALEAQRAQYIDSIMEAFDVSLAERNVDVWLSILEKISLLGRDCLTNPLIDSERHATLVAVCTNRSSAQSRLISLTCSILNPEGLLSSPMALVFSEYNNKPQVNGSDSSGALTHTSHECTDESSDRELQTLSNEPSGAQKVVGGLSNYAFHVVNSILLMTPLNSTWLSPRRDMIRQSNHSVTTHYEEMTVLRHICSLNVSDFQDGSIKESGLSSLRSGSPGSGGSSPGNVDILIDYNDHKRDQNSHDIQGSSCGSLRKIFANLRAIIEAEDVDFQIFTRALDAMHTVIKSDEGTGMFSDSELRDFYRFTGYRISKLSMVMTFEPESEHLLLSVMFRLILGQNFSSEAYAAKPFSLHMISAILADSQVSKQLVTICVKLIRALLLASPSNVCAIEEAGIIKCFLQVLASHVIVRETNNVNAAMRGTSIDSLIEVITLLRHFAMIVAPRDHLTLRSLVSILSLYIDQSCPMKSSNGIIPCCNCEVEDALLQCYDASCIDDHMACLCAECDAVFHKATSKRCHIRVPIDPAFCGNCSSAGNENYTVDIDEGCIDQNVLCIILAGVRGMIDDRRTRNLAVDGDIFDELIHAMTQFVLSSLRKSRSREVSDSRIIDLVESRTDTSASSSDATVSRTGLSPPGDNISSSPRLVVILMMQCIARFVIVDLAGEWETLSGSNSSLLFSSANFGPGDASVMCDPSCTRAELARRINKVQSLAFDALLVHLIVDQSHRVPLLPSDKQFALWMLRESIVCAVQAQEAEQASSLLRWFEWLLRCDSSKADTQSRRTTQTSSRGRSSNASSPFLSKIPLTRVDSPSDSPSPQNLVRAPLPVVTPLVSAQVRLLVIQEIRMLAGGDDLEGLVLDDAHLCRSKVFHIPWPSASVVSSDEAVMADSLRMCFASSRIIVDRSDTILKLVSSGVTSALVDIVFGDRSHIEIQRLLHSLPRSDGEVTLTTEDCAEWWSALACLGSILSGSDCAKTELKLLLDNGKLIEALGTLLTFEDVPVAVSNLFIELCVTCGQVAPPCRPFFACSVMPISAKSSEGTPFDTFMATPKGFKLGEDGFEHGTYTSISPVYYTYEGAVSYMMNCVRPLPLHLEALTTNEAIPCGAGHSSKGAVYSEASGRDQEPRQISRDARSSSLQDGDMDSNPFGRSSFRSLHALGLPNNFTSTSSVNNAEQSIGNKVLQRSLTGESAPSHASADGALEQLGADEKSIPESFATTQRDGESASATYVPFIHGCGWGLSHCVNQVMNILFEALLIRAGVPEITDSSLAGTMSSIQVSNASHIHKHAIGSHLQIFFPQRIQSSAKPTWVPNFSRLCLSSTSALKELFSAIVMKVNIHRSHMSSLLSQMINGNALNGSIISQSGVPLESLQNLCSIDSKVQADVAHMLAQLMNLHASVPLLSRALTKSLQLSAELNKCGKPSAAVILEDRIQQVLYIVRRGAERASPDDYLHFNQDSPLRSRLPLPVIDKIPAPKTGFSVTSWVRLGVIGNKPNCLLMEISRQTKSPIFVFFRVTYRMSSTYEGNEGSDTHRTVQLCISYSDPRTPSHMRHDIQSARWQRSLANMLYRDPSSEPESQLIGMDSASMLVNFSVPDMIVDFDWSEIGEWHLLNLYFSSQGISCSIDGVDRKVHQWSPLGYVEVHPEDYATVHAVYPPYSRDGQLQIQVGGFSSSTRDILLKTSSGVKSWLGKRASGLTTPLEDERIFREAEVLQTLNVAMSGFSGSIGDILVLEGPIEIKSCNDSHLGLAKGELPTVSGKPLCYVTSQDLAAHMLMYESKYSDEASHEIFMPSQRSSDDMYSSDHEDKVKREALAAAHSSVFSMFSVAKVPSKFRLEGSVCLHRTNSVASNMSSVDGFRKLIVHLFGKSRQQLSALRLLSSTISSTPRAYNEFLDMKGDQALLYCLSRSEPASAREFMHILFELTSLYRESKTRGEACAITTQMKAVDEHRMAIYDVIMDLMILSPHNLSILLSSCDILMDISRDCGPSMEHLQRSMLPFHIIMSDWSIPQVEEMQKSIIMLEGSSDFGSDRDKIAQLRAAMRWDVMKYRDVQRKLCSIIKAFLESYFRSMRNSPVLPLSVGPGSKLVSSVYTIISFALHAVRQDSAIRDKSSPRPSTIEVEQKLAASMLSAASIFLAMLTEIARGEYMTGIITTLRTVAPRNTHWYVLLHLMSASDHSIRANAVKLLRASLMTGTGHSDPKHVQAFEKIRGFAAMASRLARYSCDDMILRSLDELLLLSSKEMGVPRTPIRTPESSRPTTPVILKHRDDGVVPPFPDLEVGIKSARSIANPPKTDSQPSETPSSLMSMFTWRAKMPTASVAQEVVKEEGMQKMQEPESVFGIPQVLESIFMLLETATSSEQVFKATALLEWSFAACPILDDEECNADLVEYKNVMAVRKQKDHVMWIYDCILALSCRYSESSTIDDSTNPYGGANLSGSEASERDRPLDVMSVGESETSYGYSAATMSSYGDRHRSHGEPVVRRYTDPLFHLLKLMLRIDLLSKNTTASLGSVFRIPLPEGRDIQLTIIFDVLDCIDEHQFDDASRAIVVIRNFESFLENVLDKVEVPMELAVRVVEVISSLNYRVRPDMRVSLQDSSLGDIKNAFMSRCFTDQAEMLLSRVDALKSTKSSLESFLSSTGTRLLSGSHVALILLEMFVDCTATEECRENDLLITEGQISLLSYIRAAANASVDVRKTISKLLISQGKTGELICMAPLLLGEDHSKAITDMVSASNAQSSSSWFAWSTSSSGDMQGNSNGGALESNHTDDATAAFGQTGKVDYESFLRWFKSEEQAHIRKAFTASVLSETTDVHRFIEKMDERRTMRLSKLINALQERMKVERTQRQRSMRTIADKIRASVNQFESNFHSDLKLRLGGLVTRVESGRAKGIDALSLHNRECKTP